MSDMNISNANTSPATADRFVWTVRAAQADGSIDGLQDRVIWDAAEKKLSIEYAKTDGTFEPAKELTWCDHSSDAYTRIVSQNLIVDLDENGKADDTSGDHPYHLGDDGNAIISTTKGTDNWALSSKPDDLQDTAGFITAGGDNYEKTSRKWSWWFWDKELHKHNGRIDLNKDGTDDYVQCAPTGVSAHIGSDGQIDGKNSEYGIYVGLCSTEFFISAQKVLR